MELIQLGECENKSQLYRSFKGTSSPSPSSVTGSLNEVQVCSDAGDTEKFEIDAQIQSKNSEDVERNQQKKHWSFNQETLLLELHTELGNKWTDIANRLEGRDHNSVKNYFYAKIRKSLRRLNFFIKSYFNKQLKQLNTNHISKMITLLSQKNPHQQQCEARLQEMKQIKLFLFEISRKYQNEHLDSATLKQIQQNVIKMSQLVDSVKKNNFIIKKSKSKGKERDYEERDLLIRQSSTIKRSGRLQTLQNEVVDDAKEGQSTVKYEQGSNNLMLMFLPCEYQPEPLSLFASHYQQFWLNSTGQYIFFSSNIYGNS